MPTLDATVGGASANSYVVVADADTYFDQRLQSSAWTDEDTDDKERALIMATRRLDQLTFEGDKDTDGQALKWPRQDAFDESGYEFDTTAIPEIVKQATYELALRLLTDDDAGTDTLSDSGLEQFDSAEVGPLSVTINHAHDASALPANVLRLLRPVLKSSGHMAELSRS